MVEGLQVDLDTALRIESRYLALLMTGTNARSMINTFFFNLNAIKSGRARPAGVPRFAPKKVGILGAGLMGAGIAYVQARKGIATVLKDVSLEKAAHGKAYSSKLCQGLVDKGRMTLPAMAQTLDLIQATGDTADQRAADAVRGQAAHKGARTRAQRGFGAGITVAGRRGGHGANTQRNRGGGGKHGKTGHVQSPVSGRPMAVSPLRVENVPFPDRFPHSPSAG
jgi:hypothetical protein